MAEMDTTPGLRTERQMKLPSNEKINEQSSYGSTAGADAKKLPRLSVVRKTSLSVKSELLTSKDKCPATAPIRTDLKSDVGSVHRSPQSQALAAIFRDKQRSPPTPNDDTCAEAQE